ncbi:hypothetical protein [Rothia sp. ZJ932]|uniref:hypothetical protein n=1 Tax=Rothia sp. ZJ932 TaxID=2810516 RepID=UPI00196862AC|nr:hypothetical protein [Rothia sp. ZJ932]QRZ61814.1 hypothetical protein JR346_01330 [Rothia sp. ZJ932]
MELRFEDGYGTYYMFEGHHENYFDKFLKAETFNAEMDYVANHLADKLVHEYARAREEYPNFPNPPRDFLLEQIKRVMPFFWVNEPGNEELLAVQGLTARKRTKTKVFKDCTFAVALSTVLGAPQMKTPPRGRDDFLTTDVVYDIMKDVRLTFKRMNGLVSTYY